MLVFVDELSIVVVQKRVRRDPAEDNQSQCREAEKNEEG